jgi:hypothetical protein
VSGDEARHVDRRATGHARFQWCELDLVREGVCGASVVLVGDEYPADEQGSAMRHVDPGHAVRGIAAPSGLAEQEVAGGCSGDDPRENRQDDDGDRDAVFHDQAIHDRTSTSGGTS